MATAIETEAPRSPKSDFARRIASRKISEEFEYFAAIFERLQRENFSAPEAVLYALEHALASKASGLLNKKKEREELPVGSKVCIVGAGMSGMFYLSKE